MKKFQLQLNACFTSKHYCLSFTSKNHFWHMYNMLFLTVVLIIITFNLRSPYLHLRVIFTTEHHHHRANHKISKLTWSSRMQFIYYMFTLFKQVFFCFYFNRNGNKKRYLFQSYISFLFCLCNVSHYFEYVFM